MYVRDEFGYVVRLVKELKGFKKVLLVAGEEKEVSFDIHEEMLAFYGADMKFRAEKGSFIAYIGENSDTNNGKKFELV